MGPCFGPRDIDRSRAANARLSLSTKHQLLSDMAMSNQQTILQVKILSLLGWVDGTFEEAEGAASRRLLEGTMARDALNVELKKMGDQIPVKEEVLADIAAAPTQVARAAILSGLELAKGDGYLHEREFGILLELAAAARFPQAELDRIGKLEGVDQQFIELGALLRSGSTEDAAPK